MVPVALRVTVIEREWHGRVARMWHARGQANRAAAAESACRPGLDPGSVRPATRHRKPPVTCNCALNSSRCLAVDDDTMCPECARPGLPAYKAKNHRVGPTPRPTCLGSALSVQSGRRAGLSGGKGVPETVASHPCVFTTLTAPSFGPVHLRREKAGRILRCRPRRRGRNCLHGRRVSCGEIHESDDLRLGEPLCPDCYDYTGTVLFNAYAPELWRRFTMTLRRALARQAGLTNKALAAQVRVSFAKVGEYQRRGVVHFHAIIRLDGPAGPTTAPPAWATLTLLTAAIDQAVRAVHLQTPTAPGVPARTLTWGREADTQPVTATGELTDAKVATYLAKYATKAAECTGTLYRRLTPADKLADLPVREHARRLIAECLRLGKLPGLEDLRLIAWAHMLGIRGHFSTKSRAYSITLGSLRADRSRHQRDHAIAAGLQPDLDPDTTLILTQWQFVGRGQPYREEADAVA